MAGKYTAWKREWRNVHGEVQTAYQYRDHAIAPFAYREFGRHTPTNRWLIFDLETWRSKRYGTDIRESDAIADAKTLALAKRAVDDLLRDRAQE